MGFETIIGSTKNDMSKCKQYTRELEIKECDAPESNKVQMGKSDIEIKPLTVTFLPLFGILSEGAVSNA